MIDWKGVKPLLLDSSVATIFFKKYKVRFENIIEVKIDMERMELTFKHNWIGYTKPMTSIIDMNDVSGLMFGKEA